MVLLRMKSEWLLGGYVFHGIVIFIEKYTRKEIYNESSTLTEIYTSRVTFACSRRFPQYQVLSEGI